MHEIFESTPSLPETRANPKEADTILYLLQHHQTLMNDLEVSTTPAIYYMNERNEFQQVIGMPDKKQLIEMFGLSSDRTVDPNWCPTGRLANAIQTSYFKPCSARLGIHCLS
jgi:hypothetical protein